MVKKIGIIFAFMDIPKISVVWKTVKQNVKSKDGINGNRTLSISSETIICIVFECF
jgi:hypothetical protein